MGATVRAKHSLGLVGLSPVECARIATFIESDADAAGCPWLVLHSDSCDALIVPSDVEFAIDSDQVLIRLVRGGGAPAAGLSVATPLVAAELLAVLREAQAILGGRRQSAGGSLRVKMDDWGAAAANDRNAHGANAGGASAGGANAGAGVAGGGVSGGGYASAGHAASPRHLIHGSAALQSDPFAVAARLPDARASAMQAPQSHADVLASPPAPAMPGVARPRLVEPDHAMPDRAEQADAGGAPFAEAWDQIAVALYSIVQHAAPAVAEIRVDNLDMIRIDFRFRAYNARIPLDQLAAHGSRVAIRSKLVEAFRPPIVTLPGEALDKLFWFIGSQAFHGMAAPWMKPEDRYRLRRWPNFTELNHTVADMRVAAAIGNCFLNAAELSTAAGIAPDIATRTLNAYSLMGLLEIQAGSAAPPVAFAAPERPGGLFAKLRMKLGL